MSASRLSNSSRTPISERIKIFGGGSEKPRPPARQANTPDPSIQRPVLKPTASVNQGLGTTVGSVQAVGNGGSSASRSQFSAKDPTKSLKKSPGGGNSATSSRSDLSRTPSNASTKSNTSSTPVSKTVSRTGSMGKNSPSPTKKHINNGGSPSAAGIKKLPVSRKLSDKLIENNNNNMATSKLPQVKEPMPRTTPPAIEEKTPPRRVSSSSTTNEIPPRRVSVNSTTVANETIDTIIVGNNSSAVINFTDKTLEISDSMSPPLNSTAVSLTAADYYNNSDTVDRAIRKTSTDIMFTEQTYNNRKVSNTSSKSDVSSISAISSNGLSTNGGFGITVNGKTDSESFFTRQALNNATAESYSKVNSKVF
jgi:hypothetical protein